MKRKPSVNVPGNIPNRHASRRCAFRAANMGMPVRHITLCLSMTRPNTEFPSNGYLTTGSPASVVTVGAKCRTATFTGVSSDASA